MTNPNIDTFTPSINKRVGELSKLSELYGNFMRVERATYRDGRPETDGEHTLHAMFLAVAYTAKHHPEFNPGEVALLMMIHDLDEVYEGDVNSLTATDIDMKLKEDNEVKSRHQLRQELSAEPYILQLLERYWRQEEPIVKYVRTIEKLDPSFSHIKDGGQSVRAMGVDTLGQFSELEERVVARMEGYGNEVAPDVVGLRRILGRRVAEITFDTV